MRKINKLLLLIILILVNKDLFAQCPTDYSKFVIDITPHASPYEYETSWDIKDTLGNIVAKGTFGKDSICYPYGKKLYFTIHDTYGDGIGTGTYKVNQDGQDVVIREEFTFSKTYTINLYEEYIPQTIKLYLLAGQSNMQGGNCQTTNLQEVINIKNTIPNPENSIFNWIRDFYARDTYVLESYDSTLARNVAKAVTANSLITNKILNPLPQVQVYYTNYPYDGNVVQTPSIYKGDLQPGYGQTTDQYGPELLLGHVLASNTTEDIIFVKVAEGGSDLYNMWRSPSMEARLGKSAGIESLYPHLIKHATNIKNNPGSYIPKYTGKRGITVEVAGLIWFQGYNDQFNPDFAAGYQQNLTDLIKDVRNDMNAPKMKVVIGQSAIDGSEEGLKIMEAQKNVAEADSNAAWAPTYDLSNFYHFDPPAMTEIGYRLGNKMVNLLSKTTIKDSIYNESLLNAIKELGYHCNGTKTLSPIQINAYSKTISDNKTKLADNLSVLTEAFNLIDCYESKFGAFFMDGKWLPNSPDALDGLEYKRVIYLLMQNLFITAYNSNNLNKYTGFLNGKKYLTSKYFPGECPLPESPTKEYKAIVDASRKPSWGIPALFANRPSTRPTGYYLSPGTIGKVKVPLNLVNKGYKIQVGAHSEMGYDKDYFGRFLKVFCTYDIVDTVTLIANPFGGGIYLINPIPASNGIQEIKLSNVVPAPFFSSISHHKTSLSEWQDVQRKNLAPWAVFESELFMLTVPTNHIYNYDDPVALMKDWDGRLNTISEFMGIPIEKRYNQILYMALDVDILHGDFKNGFPSSNSTYSPFFPNDVYKGNRDIWMLKTGTSSVDNIEFHELGHAEVTTSFSGETEAICNYLYTAIQNKYYGIDLDDAFARSQGDDHKNITRDQAAMNWMVTPNFRLGIKMDESNTTKDQYKYQHRGYAKYADITDLFGWDVFNKFHYQQNLEYNNGKLITSFYNKTDERILGFCKAANADLRPLFHFWGIEIENPTTLESEIIKNKLMPSDKICKRLHHYKTVIPMDSIQFQKHGEIFLNSPITAFGESPDWGLGWYNSWLPKYKKPQGDSAVVAIDKIINKYYPTGCPVTSVEKDEINKSNILIFPNPNNGQFTIVIPENEADIKITNIVGQTILNKKTDQKSTNIQINDSGVYLITIKTKSGTEVKKVIVNN